jgi:uncharacterized membrane-anchored protein
MLLRSVWLCGMVLIAAMSGANAQDSPSQKSEMHEALVAAFNAATQGPADVPLRELATVHLPDLYSFIPNKEGAALMHAMGNATDQNFYGLIVSRQQKQYWFVTIDYRDSGHIKDDDAKSWNADELLQSIKDNTEADNKDRTERGFPALDVVGWVEAPTYDPAAHRLLWSMLAKERGHETEPATVNYNTYALGRQGYFELDLVTDEKDVAEDKKHAGIILSALDYKPGERYTDYNSSTDRLAEYGLAALIGGIAAKKLGLLAVVGVVFVKLWKFILIGLAVAGGGVTKLFRRKNKTPQA